MSAGTLRHLPDRQLLSRMIQVARQERAATLDAVLHLAEIDRRRLYAGLGFSSLFDYCTRHLKYSSSAAGRRIQAARCIRRHRQVLSALRRGDVTLHTVALIASVITEANGRDLLSRVRGKTQREVESIVAEHKPPVAFRDRVRPVCVHETAHGVTSAPDLAPRSEPEPAWSRGACEKDNFSHSGSNLTETVVGKPATNSHSSDTADSALPSGHSQQSTDKAPAAIIKKKLLIQFLADEAFMEKYEEARALLSNRAGDPSFEAVFGALLNEFVERHSPASRRKRRAARKAKAATKAKKKPVQEPSAKSPDRTEATVRPERSRRIPAAVKDEVFVRDGGRCTYIGSTGKRCAATHHLHIDHIKPFSRGGATTPSNLRLLCAGHNRSEAERLLDGAMTRFRRRE